jgi:hypothetical protein
MIRSIKSFGRMVVMGSIDLEIQREGYEQAPFLTGLLCVDTTLLPEATPPHCTDAVSQSFIPSNSILCVAL